MKILRLLITLFFFALSLPGFTQILNNSFESWTAGEPDNWTTNNAVPSFVPLTQSADAHSGSSSIRGAIVDFNGTIIPPFLNSPTTGAFTMTQTYSQINGWYNATLLGNDLFGISVSVYDAGSNSVGFGFMNLPGTLAWQPFVVNVNYTPGAVPATIQLTFNIFDNTGMTGGTVGSFFLLDDLEFAGSTGINNLNASIFNVGPNPATEHINIAGDFITGDVMNVSLVNMVGQSVLSSKANVISDGTLPPIDISQLPAGIYSLNISNDKKSLSRRIVISH